MISIYWMAKNQIQLFIHYEQLCRLIHFNSTCICAFGWSNGPFLSSKLSFKCIFVFQKSNDINTGGSCLCSGPSIATLGAFIKQVGIQNTQNQWRTFPEFISSGTNWVHINLPKPAINVSKFILALYYELWNKTESCELSNLIVFIPWDICGATLLVHIQINPQKINYKNVVVHF